MEMAVQRNPRIQNDVTSQGLYVAGADGTCYGFINHRGETQRIHQFLDRCLAEFRQTPPQRVEIGEKALSAPFARTPDPTASVLRVFSRIHPLPPGVSSLNEGPGRDHLWIYADELKEIRAAAPENGRDFSLPKSLVARLTRFHLIDNVRGEPDMWKPAEVTKAEFTARRVRDDGETGVYAFSGIFAMRAANGGRGYEGTISGEFVVDNRAARITRFRAYGKGQAWGVSTYTPEAPKGRFPLLIAIVETDDPTARTVPPQAVACGHEYRNPDWKTEARF